MKQYILLIFILWSGVSYAQLKNIETNTNTIKPEVSLSTAATVFNIGNQTFFGAYISPQLSYQLTPKININTGFIIGNFNSTIQSKEDDYIPSFNAGPMNLFFVEGRYHYSKNLIFSGSTTMQIPCSTNKYSPLDNQQNFKDYKFGIDYKISEGVYIKAEVGYSNRPLFYPQSNTFHPYPFY